MSVPSAQTNTRWDRDETWLPQFLQAGTVTDLREPAFGVRFVRGSVGRHV